jgi:hypothetical protein
MNLIMFSVDSDLNKYKCLQRLGFETIRGHDARIFSTQSFSWFEMCEALQEVVFRGIIRIVNVRPHVPSTAGE